MKDMLSISLLIVLSLVIGQLFCPFASLTKKENGTVG